MSGYKLDAETQATMDKALIEMLTNKSKSFQLEADMLRAQKPYWRPIAECGELDLGLYIVLSSGMRCCMEWSTTREWLGRPEWLHDDSCLPEAHDHPSHILYLGTDPVTVPAAPESETP